jgi:pantoate--beta-alanine ligase
MSMEVVTSVRAMQGLADTARCAGSRLALVPTMGALHAGHLALAAEAASRADHVTVTIFVNPTQFGPGEDFDRYPRTLEADLDLLRQQGHTDVVFAPSVEEIYPEGNRTTVRVEGLDRHLCGEHRPGHFDGVTTVVSRLYLACRPDVALFGRKDAQQLIILQRMTRDLRFGIEVVGVETVREDDGLAMSSRNRYLAPEERRQATVLYRAVKRARLAVKAGEREPAALVSAMLDIIQEAPLAHPQYARVVDSETLEEPAALMSGRTYLAAVAVIFDGARLIDNQFFTVP